MIVRQLLNERRARPSRYAFPAERWRNLRPANPLKLPLAGIRLRTTAAKRLKIVESATALIRDTFLVIEHHVRELNAPCLYTTMYDDVLFHDSICTIVPNQKSRNAWR